MLDRTGEEGTLGGFDQGKLSLIIVQQPDTSVEYQNPRLLLDCLLGNPRRICQKSSYGKCQATCSESDPSAAEESDDDDVPGQPGWPSTLSSSDSLPFSLLL